MEKLEINLSEILLVVVVPFALFFQTWPTAMLALGLVLNYSLMRWQANELSKNNSYDDHISDIGRDLSRLEAEMRALKEVNREVVKQAEDVKKIVQAHNLKQMFGPKV